MVRVGDLNDGGIAELCLRMGRELNLTPFFEPRSLTSFFRRSLKTSRAAWQRRLEEKETSQ